jgi:drug/metabolite transporter (DMT)-like permease
VRWNLGMALLAASWGLIAVLVAAVELEATVLAFARLAVAALTLALAAALARRLDLLDPAGRLRQLVLLGVVQAAHWLLFFEAAKRGSVALAVVTFYAAPVLLALVAPLVLPERTTSVVALGVLAGGAGVVLVALGGGEGGGSASPAAIACGLGAAATYALLVVLSRRLLLADTPPLTVAFWDCAVGALALAPLLLTASRVAPTGAGEWGTVLLLGVVFTGLSTLVYATLLRHVTAQIAGLLTFLEPVTGIVLAAWLLDQELDAVVGVGAALVLGAGVLVVLAGPSGVRVADAPAGVGSEAP